MNVIEDNEPLLSVTHQSSPMAILRNHPVLALVTAALLLLFMLHVVGLIKLDGHDIVLLVLAALPWSLRTILSAVEAIGLALTKANLRSLEIGYFKIERLEKKLDTQESKLDEQRRVLDDLTLYSMAFYIYEKLKYLHLGTLPAFRERYGEYNYVPEDRFDHDLRYLRDHGYLALFQFATLQPGQNLVGLLTVTPMGQRFVELKEARAGNPFTPSEP